jgi:S1-C subfamily serine protease
MKRLGTPLALLFGLLGAVTCFVCGYLWGIRTERFTTECDAAPTWHGYPEATHGDDFLTTIVSHTIRVNANLVGGIDGASSPMMGTGVIISTDGLILTAWHISDPSREVTVQLCRYVPNASGDIRCAAEEHPATVVAMKDDIALLRLKSLPKDLPVALLGLSEALEPGELLWRVGLDRVGIACGPVNRIPEGAEAHLDVLLPTHGGGSGGPLYNSRGEVVGIITSSPMNGLRGWAVPMNRIRSLFPELTPVSPKP